MHENERHPSCWQELGHVALILAAASQNRELDDLHPDFLQKFAALLETCKEDSARMDQEELLGELESRYSLN